MSEYTVYSISTVFHLMMSKLYMKKSNSPSIVICQAINPIISEIIREDNDFSDYLVIKRVKRSKNKLISALKNRSNIQKVKKFINQRTIERAIIFKDNDLINQSITDIAVKKGAKVTLMEEGLGLYKKPQEGLVYHRQNWIKKNLFSYPMYRNKSQGMYPIVNEIVANNPQLLPSEKIINKKVVEEKFDQLSRVEIGELYNYFNINDIQFSPLVEKRKVVLYIGQPFSEFRSLSLQYEQKGLAAVFSHLLKDKDIYVLVKPHPSEDIRKYEPYIKDDLVELFTEYHVPAELIPAILDIDLVLTGYSSACYYINKWYNIRSLSLYNIFFTEHSNGWIFKEKIEPIYNMKLINNITELDAYL
ncbi:hypothetical protein SAMN05421736_113123 [Evansella caseinilytica]|uniref:Uncharacterized protein n=1 Tax=Evansella caseinilytica TaxID=1503961 RepID=A0A1H3TA15_9BACI|nr:polysialyltransferase family glycosyltransferase [Evansella caseinilytica]SDZ46691.1 hypothetical protein SAMN05421736_113123 [Evansella caseinilytica]